MSSNVDEEWNATASILSLPFLGTRPPLLHPFPRPASLAHGTSYASNTHAHAHTTRCTALRPSPCAMQCVPYWVRYALRVERVYSSMSSGTDGGGANPTTGTRPLTTLLLRLDYSYPTPLYRFYCRHPRAGAAAHTRVHQAPGLISSSRAKQGMPPPLYVRRIHAAVACERSLA